jgi:hypothetical protein
VSRLTFVNYRTSEVERNGMKKTRVLADCVETGRTAYAEFLGGNPIERAERNFARLKA